MVLVTLYKSADRGRRLSGIDSLAETAKQNPRLWEEQGLLWRFEAFAGNCNSESENSYRTDSGPRHRADFAAKQPSDNSLETRGVFELQDLNCINLKIQQSPQARFYPVCGLFIIGQPLLSFSCRYFHLVVMLEWPNRLATLAIDTPVKSSRAACVCRRPWTEMTGIWHRSQYRLKTSFTVEL